MVLDGNMVHDEHPLGRISAGATERPTGEDAWLVLRCRPAWVARHMFACVLSPACLAGAGKRMEPMDKVAAKQQEPVIGSGGCAVLP